jgi:aryl-alcohol dehydrogenase-like predicted oxidoreductase
MSEQRNMNRRGFLKNTALGIAGAGVIGTASSTDLLAGEDKKKQEKQEKQENELKIKAFRTLGRTGFKASDISSGGPMNEAILNAVLDAGVNYIDTAENYGNGRSETITGKVIKNRDRKSLFITSKLGIKKDDTKETILKRSRKCLERLGTDYLDCMMIHSAPRVIDLKNEAFHAAMKQLKTEGKLRYIGLSNHGSQWKDDVDPMEKVCLAAAADGRFDLMLMVYNFIQKDVGEQIIKACQEKNIGVTLMKTNPVGGYTYFKEGMDEMKKQGQEIPKFYQSILPRLKAKAERAQDFVKKHKLDNPTAIRNAAIKFTLKHPGVHSVCCSFHNFDLVDTYLALSGSVITATEEKKLTAYKEGCGSFYCRHACGICESACPHNVPVNTIMRYNHYFEAQGREKHAMQKYAALPTTKADVCANCSGICESACPYDVPAQGLLTLAHHRLSLA